MSGPIKNLPGSNNGGSTTSSGNSTAGQTGTMYADGWPTVNPTELGETAYGSFLSPNPTEMSNAWELPQNSGALRLPSGLTTQVPTSASDRTLVSQSVQMIDLYAKLAAVASGKKITFSTGEINNASQLGGDIARAVQMAGGKNGDKAAGAAITEIATRLKGVGIGPEVLANPSGKVSPQLANLLQNSGYAVTKNMTLKQMLNETSGSKAQTPLGSTSQNMTVGQYIQGLGNLNKAQLQTLQTSLYNSGFYDASYYDGGKTFTTGILDVATITAMRKAMQTSLQNNVPLESVIGGALPVPSPGTNGLSSTTTPDQTPTGTSAAATTIPQTQSSQLQDPLIKAFESALGRAPSAQELANFTASYNQTQQDASNYALKTGQSPQTAIDLQTGVPYLPTTPTASAASAAYAMNANPIEYQAHGVANAFGMLMNLVDRSGTSALDTLGRSPNVSS